MTRHPEPILSSLDEFDTYPDWVPILGGHGCFRRNSRLERWLTPFEQGGYAAKVLNASRLGSQYRSNPQLAGRVFYTAATDSFVAHADNIAPAFTRLPTLSSSKRGPAGRTRATSG